VSHTTRPRGHGAEPAAGVTRLSPEDVVALVQRVGRAPRVVILDDDAAAGHVEAVHDDETARRRDFIDGVEGDRFFVFRMSSAAS